MNKLMRIQWEELDDQINRTPAEPGSERARGEHMKLIAVLNRLEFNPIMSKGG